MIMQLEANQIIQYINLEQNELPPMLEHNFIQWYLKRRDPVKISIPIMKFNKFRQ